jgi:sugar lactone lactonase YvrE
MSSSTSSPQRQPTILSTDHFLLECPRWHDGRLYVSDFFAHRVLVWAGDRFELVCEVPGRPAGLGWDLDGNLLIVSMVDQRLLSFDGAALTTIAELSAYASWRCNDMVVDAAGGAYVGNFGWDASLDPTIRSTSLVRVDTKGENVGNVEVVADDLVCPNGMAITPDGGTLLVNETFAARVTAFDRQADGSLTNRRVWASFSDRSFETSLEAAAAGVILPDGMALCEDGTVWLADCAGAGASRVAEGGDVLEYVSTADHATFACALGDSDLRTLYLTTARPYPHGRPAEEAVSDLRRCRVDVAGAGPS